MPTETIKKGDPPVIPNSFREIRDGKNISRLALSMETESMISAVTISQVERGSNHRIKTAIELCNALGITLNDMFESSLTALRN